MMKIEITISKKIFWLCIICGMLVAGVLVFAAKPNPGHSINEVEGLQVALSELQQPAAAWPAGSYCLLRAGGECPEGFEVGIICLDTEDDENKDSLSGSYGDSGANTCGTSSKELVVCCK